jgi:hypothetical protein
MNTECKGFGTLYMKIHVLYIRNAAMKLP